MKKSKTTYIALMFFAVIGFVFIQCTKEKELPKQEVTQQERIPVQAELNPTPKQIGEIPAATVKLKTFESTAYIKSGESTSSLTPTELIATLAAEESIDETKTGYIEGAPPKGDLMFCVDLTGSMGGELANAKVNSINIMNAVRGVIPDTYFGVMSHMDYVGNYTGCGYSNTYGDASSGDYPYSLDQPMTQTCTNVATSMNGLALGYGWDGPENYSRPFYESYSDASIGWRTCTKKIVLAWLDYVPHDCAYDNIIGGTATSGPDPGRDGVVGGGDDLAILDVLQGMSDNNITLIVLYSGSGDLPLWQAYTALTGGTAVQINTDGTIPGDEDIAEFIANLILDEISHIDEITLEVCTPGFEPWLTEVNPAFYTADVPWTGDFEITITVPAGTMDGLYEFEICLMGDGVKYACQDVSITVQNAIEVPFDIHPTSCPNPINRKGNGKLPAAILGLADFDASQIDPTTVNINGVYPIKWNIEDVATPYYPFIGKELYNMSCNTDGPDGYLDLTLKFNNQEIASLLAGYMKGDIVRLELTGELYDGTAIIGEDIIVIVK